MRSSRSPRAMPCGWGADFPARDRGPRFARGGGQPLRARPNGPDRSDGGLQSLAQGSGSVRALAASHPRPDSVRRVSLSHEFLAIMLGVERTTVTAVAGALQRAGTICYVHGQVTVVNRAGLEGASCECYRIVAVHFESDRPVTISGSAANARLQATVGYLTDSVPPSVRLKESFPQDKVSHGKPTAGRVAHRR